MTTPIRGLAAILLVVTALVAQDQRRPANIVVLFADDAGYADFGFQPNADSDLAKLTPHIDTIARDGARFSNAYMSAAVCSPSRAGLFTGRHQQRFGHERNIPPGYMKGGMSLDESTIADRLRPLGRATAMIGKWHLGYPEEDQPNQRGFDHFFGLLQGSRSYFPYDDPTPHRVIQQNGEPLPEEGYVTDRFGTAAAEFIGAHAEEPFYLFVSFTAPHGPLQAKEADLAKLGHIENPRRRKFAGLITALDDAVGVILAAIHDAGLDDHTLVVFTNDNGGQTRVGAVNTPLRGRKGQLWEGGVRVPMAMRWPGTIDAGTVIDDPVISLDFVPTFVAVAGGKVRDAWELDGIDLGQRLAGVVDTLPERALRWRTHGENGPIAIRRGDDKLLIERDAEGGETVHLFDLATDIGETKNLADARPDRVRALRGELRSWERELIEPLWGSPPRRRR